MKRTEQKRRIAKLALAGGFLFGCFVVADLAIIMAGENLELINPDFLYGIEFLRDLRTSGSDWFWITPPSAYWFPDLLILAPIELAFNDIGYIFTANWLVYLVLLGGVTYFLIRIWSGQGLAKIKVAFAALVIVCLQMMNYLYAPEFGRHIFYPTTHAGALLVGIVLLGLALLILKRPDQKRYYLGYLILAIFTAASDPLLLSQFVLPIAAGCWLLALFKRTSWRVAMINSVMAVVTLGSTFLIRWLATLSQRFQFPSVTEAEVSGGILASLSSLMQNDQNAWYRLIAPWTTVVAVLAVVVILVWYLWSVLNKEAHQDVSLEKHNFQHGLVLVGLCLIATLIVPFVTAKWANITCQRYLLPLYFFPFVVLVGFFTYYRPTRKIWTWVSAGVFMLVVFVQTIIPNLDRLNYRTLQTPHVPLVWYLDGMNRAHQINHDGVPMKYGLSHMRYAREVSLLSRTGMQANVLNPDLTPRLDRSNVTNWFSDEGAVPYQFIIVDSLNRQLLVDRYGDPDKVVLVPHRGYLNGGEIWFYQSPLSDEHLRREVLQEVGQGPIVLPAEIVVERIQ